jgi:predicted  nucleic acid-binding Zn-ribbon protein
MGTAFALYKSIRMQPIERASGDADAAKKYAEVSGIAADQVRHALERIDTLEQRSSDMEDEVEGLQDSLAERDKCINVLNEEIRRRDNLIEEWTKGIRILVAQMRVAGLIPDWSPKEWKQFP